MLFICLVAAGLRLWQLDAIPNGLYRDEAFNGIDAVDVLAGNHSLFFPANNGREPTYIYLTALNIAIWGQNTFAVRLAAALSGTLTTLFVYLLGKSWWNRSVGLLTAWLWATTVWTIHLSRIGLRPILLIPLLTAAVWLVTEAYKRQRLSLWFIAGFVYGLAFYTYLAIRLTPALAIFIFAWLWWHHREEFPWRGLLVAGAGLGLALIPWGILAFNQPEILLGRTGQVSILHPDINGGNLFGALFDSVWRTLGLFIWEGDDIIRHNPAGRPLFDVIMAIPFLIGVLHCVRQWRQTTSVILLSWTALMLLGTILAEDPPHFLRAIGILPVVLFFPALGLQEIGRWFKENVTGYSIFLSLLLLGSLGFTIQDYFIDYGRDAQTGYLFESPVRELVRDVNQQPDDVTVVLESRFVEGWPSVSFLLDERDNVKILQTDAISSLPPDEEMAFYLWPHDTAAWGQVATFLAPTHQLTAVLGPLTRGDLEPDPYPLYVRYQLSPIETEIDSPAVATFVDSNGAEQHLLGVETRLTSSQELKLDLTWEFARPESVPLVTFIHVFDPISGTLMTQLDTPPASGYIPHNWWGNIGVIQEQKRLDLPRPLRETDQILLGVYQAGAAAEPFEIAGQSGHTVWPLPHPNMNTD